MNLPALTRHTLPSWLLVACACQGATAFESTRVSGPPPELGGAPGSAGPGCTPSEDPGHVSLRRLNRDEYTFTLQDLLGITSRPGDALPGEPSSADGFDNNGAVLPMSVELAGAINAATARAVTEALANPVTAESLMGCPSSTGQQDFVSTDPVATWHEGSTVVPAPAELTRLGWLVFQLPAAAITQDYTELIVHASGTASGGVWPTYNLNIQDLPAATQVSVTSAVEAPYVLRHDLSRGQPYKIGIQFSNPTVSGDRKLRVTRITLRAAGEGACTRELLRRFARRAFRREVTANELSRLESLVTTAQQAGIAYREAVGFGLQAALASPSFLYQVLAADGATARPLRGTELAARLSYFLWSGPPDGELLDRAASGALENPDVLAEQAARLLADGRAARFRDSFAGQWLATRAITSRTVAPDASVFGAFPDSLRAAMKRETDLLFDHVVRSDQSPLQLLVADYTFLNEELASHYGIPGVAGAHLRQVPLAGTQRRGVLTHGSFLVATSKATETSPTARGHWVLERITCTPPPDAPPGIEPLPSNLGGTLTLRERLAQHRSDPMCQGCHVAMDPIGLGLEHFDGVGRYRTHDGANPVDAAGTLPEAGEFSDHLTLAELLKEDARVRRCITTKVLAYALGRSVTHEDACLIRSIADAAVSAERPFSALVEAIVRSAPFRAQRFD